MELIRCVATWCACDEVHPFMHDAHKFFFEELFALTKKSQD